MPKKKTNNPVLATIPPDAESEKSLDNFERQLLKTDIENLIEEYSDANALLNASGGLCNSKIKKLNAEIDVIASLINDVEGKTVVLELNKQRDRRENKRQLYQSQHDLYTQRRSDNSDVITNAKAILEKINSGENLLLDTLQADIAFVTTYKGSAQNAELT
jgi:hypothetical protein